MEPTAIIAAVQTAVQTVGSISSLIGKIGGVPDDHKPPTWDDTNSLSQPIVKNLMSNLVSEYKKDELILILDNYVRNAIQYIANSKHATANTNATYVSALQNEVIYKVDVLGFASAPESQLAYALWLHAMWSFGNFGKDEIASGKAASEFAAQLNVTLNRAIKEAIPTANVPTTVSLNPNSEQIKTTVKKETSYTPIAILFVIGVALIVFGIAGKN